MSKFAPRSAVYRAATAVSGQLHELTRSTPISTQTAAASQAAARKFPSQAAAGIARMQPAKNAQMTVCADLIALSLAATTGSARSGSAIARLDLRRSGIGPRCLRHAVPPDLAPLAEIALELGLQDTVEDHSRQRIARLACDQVRPGGLRPDVKELFRRHLIGDVPVGHPARRSGCKHFVAEVHVFLELHPAPVLGQLHVASLHRERCVPVLAIRGEEGGEHRLVALLPGRLVALHESIDVRHARPYPGISASTSWPRSVSDSCQPR